MKKASPRYFDLSLGDHHFLAWVRNREGEIIVGGIIRHPKADNPSGYCEGSFDLDIPEQEKDSKRATWKLSGSFDARSIDPLSLRGSWMDQRRPMDSGLISNPENLIHSTP